MGAFFRAGVATAVALLPWHSVFAVSQPHAAGVPASSSVPLLPALNEAQPPTPLGATGAKPSEGPHVVIVDPRYRAIRIELSAAELDAATAAGENVENLYR